MTSSHGNLPRRWYAVGDPQADLSRLLETFRHHGLLDGDRLRDDVGLVSMGDHFDFGEVKLGQHEEFARKGLEVLEWFASHPREQVRMLFGNHDLARVQELVSFSDDDFAEARMLALDGQEDELRRRFPELPSASLITQDFSGFSTTQRTRVQQLLSEGRLECALVGKVGGRECLLSHAGVKQRERDLLGLDDDISLVELVTELREWFAGRVYEAATAWNRGENVPLDLAPLHLAGVAGQEAGGWFAARPANPNRPGIKDPEWEWNPSRPRRFDPHDLLPGVLQVVGHTGDKKLRRELVPWVDGDLGGHHEIHSLELSPHGPRYRKGFD
ncbi:MAG: metallophosphoesterase, partial [Myxococcales bacterium]|nr:metallophosphoesterase [Myxococcales bacterium]